MSRIITITATAGSGWNNGIGVVFKNCAPFTNCVKEISNFQIDNSKDIDVVMPVYNLMEYNDNYWKTLGSLWQH